MEMFTKSLKNLIIVEKICRPKDTGSLPVLISTTLTSKKIIFTKRKKRVSREAFDCFCFTAPRAIYFLSLGQIRKPCELIALKEFLGAL